MTPKHRAILAQVPVALRAAAQAYYDELSRFEAEASEFQRAQVKLNNVRRELWKKHQAVDNRPHVRAKGALYVDLQSGYYYEGTGEGYVLRRLKSDGYEGKRTRNYPRGPLVELPPDHPFREKRRVATICNRLEGKQP